MSPFTTMSTVNVVVGTIFIVLALVLLIPGMMATAEKLPGNKYVGLHVPAVRKNESVWRQAHKVAGPFWILGGVALSFGAAFAFIAQGWVWLFPVIALVLAVVAASVGGNFGARAAVAVEEAQKAEPAAPKPQVNLDALRKAAGKADEK